MQPQVYAGSSAPSSPQSGDVWLDTISAYEVVLGANSASSSTTLANVTGMSFTAEASKIYEVDFLGIYQSAATTTGIGIALDIPSGTVAGINITSISTTAVGGSFQRADAAILGASASVDALNSNVPLQAKWLVSVGVTGGTVQLMLRSEIASSAVTLQANLCILRARKIN